MGLSDRDYMRDDQGGHSFWARDGLIKGLIVANVAVFLLQAVFGLLPQTFGAMSLERLRDGQLWTLITYAFVHADLLHLAMNMLVLFFIGRTVEQLLGSQAFLWIYTGGALAGAALHLTSEFLFGPSVPVVGASGAVFAVFVALATMLPNVRVQLFFIPIGFKAWHVAAFVVGISALFMLLSLTGLTEPGRIAHTVHLGGALFGFAWVRWSGFGDGKMQPEDFLRMRHERERRSDKVVRDRWRKRFGASKVVDAEVDDERRRHKADVDAILEKIHREGMASLSAEERRTLERASEMLAERKGGRRS